MTERKPKFKLIETPTPNQPEPDYLLIYNRIIFEKLTQAATLDYVEPEIRKQLIYYYVKEIPLRYNERSNAAGRITDKKALNDVYSTIRFAAHLIGQVTPRELIKIYPIKKSYDGNKYGTVDYFSTMENLENFGMDEPITEDKVFDMLFNYDNEHICEYVCTMLCVISGLRRCEGQPGIGEEFASQHGIRIFNKMTDADGKQFLYDPDKHTTCSVVKPRPRYLRLV